ncbi:hypothetical protein VST7929_02881 [Vibrio stylophorae]|uniref:Short-chain dehydrogenase n=1 Tax=Vibrio stylophorae TaxID=659351 RepID=A0ABM8ZX61_9VIBR|nr:SDR family oxidoreductase [Vibrio stylophorae]CAH0535232.1 hypothetical protein VST7929_02881 [Vibrio stylophorae]
MSKTVLITGANRGIGLALAKAYAAQGAQVIGVCRSCDPALRAVATQVISGIDVTQAEDVRCVVSALDEQRIDVLINNAGCWGDETLGDIHYDEMLDLFAINTLAPLRVTEALLNHLTRGSKVVNITSRMGSIEDNSSGGRYGYRASKAALNAIGKSLAIDLAPRGIAVAQIHPGFVKTRMVDFDGLIEPEESAQGIIARIEALDLAQSGGFWHANGESLPW